MPRLRDAAEATGEELAAVREQFVTHFVIADLDFAGHLDLTGIREFGAKWARYCAWLYDQKQHRYRKDFLAEQIPHMQSLQVRLHAEDLHASLIRTVKTPEHTK